MGTVFLGLAGHGRSEAVELYLDGSRWDIRLAAVHQAVRRLRTLLGQR